MIKRFLCTASLVLLGLATARAFSLAGPYDNGGDNWQQVSIGYGPPTAAIGPKNIGEGYRRNIPVMYYAYTPAFLDYFGTAGETNIDAAFSILNGDLNNGVSSYSADLSELPLETQQINYTAQALQLYDMKSMTLGFMMTQLGLDSPELNVWKLHDRIVPAGGKCPTDVLYTVIQRNFGITPSAFNQIQYSPYVDNTLYTFDILEACGGTVTADTAVVPVDTLGDAYESVAGSFLEYGGYYTDLTSDDIAGLRYLLSTNNVNWETVGGGSLLFDESTNTSAGETLFPANPNSPTGFGTFSLASLYSFSKTNSPATVLANFPGIVISSSSYYFGLASNVTVTSYYAPPKVGSPYGSPLVLTYVTNYTPYLATNYVMTFANVVPVVSNSSSSTILMTVTTGPQAGQPYGTPFLTTTNYQTLTTANSPSGDFYVVPQFGTNSCGSGIIYLGLTSVISTTNLITAATTNVLTATNSTTYSSSQSLISSYTSHTYVAYPVNCGQTAAATGLYQGMDKMRFIRVNYDSLLGQTFVPVTNGFSLVAITNSTMRPEHFDRVVATPDVLLDAVDLATGIPNHPLFGVFMSDTTVPAWNQANILPGLAGPGTINPTTTLTFGKQGDLYESLSLAEAYAATNAFLNQTTIYQLLAYGSFDGTTNAPVVYPNGSSIQNLQNQLLVQVSPTALNLYTNYARAGSAYLYQGSPVQFTLTGGGGAFDLTDPFTWTAVGPAIGGPATTGLPPGLTLSASGQLTGTPYASGTYDFTLIFTDYYSHSVQWNYTIIIQ